MRSRIAVQPRVGVPDGQPAPLREKVKLYADVSLGPNLQSIYREAMLAIRGKGKRGWGNMESIATLVTHATRHLREGTRYDLIKRINIALNARVEVEHKLEAITGATDQTEKNRLREEVETLAKDHRIKLPSGWDNATQLEMACSWVMHAAMLGGV